MMMMMMTVSITKFSRISQLEIEYILSLRILRLLFDETMKIVMQYSFGIGSISDTLKEVREELFKSACALVNSSLSSLTVRFCVPLGL